MARLDEAQAELESVLSSAPDNLAALRAIADVHERRGDLQQAIEYHRRAAPLASRDPAIEDAIERLRRDIESTSQPAPGPDVAGAYENNPASQAATSKVDFDRLLESLGAPNRAAPPMIEALLTTPGSRLPNSLESMIGVRLIAELELWLGALDA